MTAGIGVFNKYGAVLAADSAVTIGNGRKVYNTANKIFKLGDSEKLGVFIYNFSHWMGIPLEIIVKQYAKKSADRTLDNLKEYIPNFISFLENEMSIHISKNEIDFYLKNQFYNFSEDIISEANFLINEDINNNKTARPKDEKDEQKLLTKYVLQISSEIINDFKEEEVLNNYKEITFDEFKEQSESDLKSIINGFISNYNLTSKNSKLYNMFLEIVYQSLISDPSEDYIGIVFAGFGETEIYPSIEEIRFEGFYNNKIKFYTFGSGKIDNDNSALIAPFADSEMGKTFMEGINPRLEEDIIENMIFALNNLQSEIEDEYNLENSTLDEKFESMYIDFIESLEDSKRKNMVEPVINTLGILGKEDMIDLAESLVGITSLKRKTSLEIETVGGPIDVALITKNEGFTWVKRKERISGF